MQLKVPDSVILTVARLMGWIGYTSSLAQYRCQMHSGLRENVCGGEDIPKRETNVQFHVTRYDVAIASISVYVVRGNRSRNVFVERIDVRLGSGH